MRMGITKLISREWKWERHDGNGRNDNTTFSHFQSVEEKQPVSGATSATTGTSADSDTLDCHSPPAKKRRVFDFKCLFGSEDDQQQDRSELAEYDNLYGNGSGNRKGMGIKLG